MVHEDTRAHPLLLIMNVTRRLTALIGILAIVVLTVLLMWRVYLHHRAGGDEDDEPGVIAAVTSGGAIHSGPTLQPAPAPRGLL